MKLSSDNTFNCAAAGKANLVPDADGGIAPAAVELGKEALPTLSR